MKKGRRERERERERLELKLKEGKDDTRAQDQVFWLIIASWERKRVRDRKTPTTRNRLRPVSSFSLHSTLVGVRLHSTCCVCDTTQYTLCVCTCLSSDLFIPKTSSIAENHSYSYHYQPVKIARLSNVITFFRFTLSLNDIATCIWQRLTNFNLHLHPNTQRVYTFKYKYILGLYLQLAVVGFRTKSLLVIRDTVGVYFAHCALIRKVYVLKVCDTLRLTNKLFSWFVWHSYWIMSISETLLINLKTEWLQNTHKTFSISNRTKFAIDRHHSFTQSSDRVSASYHLKTLQYLLI